jgi:hypothetical protein
MPVDKIHYYAICIGCGKKMDVRTDEFAEHNCKSSPDGYIHPRCEE